MNKNINRFRGLIVFTVVTLAVALAVNIVLSGEISVEYQDHDTKIHVEVNRNR